MGDAGKVSLSGMFDVANLVIGRVAAPRSFGINFRRERVAVGHMVADFFIGEARRGDVSGRAFHAVLDALGCDLPRKLQAVAARKSSS